MGAFKVEMPPAIAESLKHLHPDLRRHIKQALIAIAEDPACGVMLLRELKGLYKFRVRRYRIVYEVVEKSRVVRILAIAHRETVYRDVALMKK